MRRCSDCHVEKDEANFYLQKRGWLSSQCKPCMRARNKKWHQANRARVNERERRRRKLHPGRSTEYVRRWRDKNPERNAVLNAPSDRRREMDRARYWNTPGRRESVIAKLAALNKRRPEIKNAIIARRRALQKKALVSWANKKKMRDIYAEAKRLERETGFKHHVDHIVPLQSPIVCGLHWEANLQVLRATENHSKGNKLLEAA
mgnify:FL=1